MLQKKDPPTMLSYLYLFVQKKNKLTGLERLQDVLENHGPSDNPITIRQLPEDDDYQQLLKFISTCQENHIVIDCTPDKVMKLFRQAFGVKMMTDYQVQ